MTLKSCIGLHFCPIHALTLLEQVYESSAGKGTVFEPSGLIGATNKIQEYSLYTQLINVSLLTSPLWSCLFRGYSCTALLNWPVCDALHDGNAQQCCWPHLFRLLCLWLSALLPLDTARR